MNNDSKKRQELKKQVSNKIQTSNDLASVEKALMFITSPKRFNLIEKATTMPTNKKTEAQRFILCFDYFNWKACQFEQFNPAKGKKLLEILAQVAKCEINKFPELKLGRDSIGKVKPYESFFSTVSPEVSKLEETEFCEGRLYYFITEPNFNVVGVDTKHR